MPITADLVTFSYSLSSTPFGPCIVRLESALTMS